MQNSIQPIFAKGGFFGGIIQWFIRVVIYDICVTTIQDVLGVSRMTALFIFLGIMMLVAFIGYMIKQKAAGAADD
jgi:hypothetical protein